MLEIKTLQKYDKSGIYKIYDDWPSIAHNSFNLEYEQIETKGISHIVFSGMGGSGNIGDVFSSILSKTNIHVSVVKGYLLPNTVNVDTLIINTSISGNTDEALNVLKLSKEKKCKILALSSGGKMEDFCKKKQIDFRKIPFRHSPRASFTEFLYALLKILSSFSFIKKTEINESLMKMKKIRRLIYSGNLSNENPSISLAEWMKGIPLVYYPNGLNAAAIRFKNSLQENSKMHTIIEDVVESGHNGIVSWDKTSNVQPILLQGKDDFIKTKERWKIFKSYFEEKNIEYKEIHSVSGNILTKLICLIYLLDYSTIYRAALSKIDPSPTYAIDYIKKRL